MEEGSSSSSISSMSSIDKLIPSIQFLGDQEKLSSLSVKIASFQSSQNSSSSTSPTSPTSSQTFLSPTFTPAFLTRKKRTASDNLLLSPQMVTPETSRKSLKRNFARSSSTSSPRDTANDRAKVVVSTSCGLIHKNCEDRHTVLLGSDLKNLTSPEKLELFCGVFDGHAGARCSTYLANNLHRGILEVMDNAVLEETAIPNLLIRAFKNIDVEFLDFAREWGWQDGSTALVTILYEDTLFTAFTGDCAAVLYSSKNGGSINKLTDEHHPSRKDEKARIEMAGGNIQHWDDRGVERVFVSPTSTSGLAVTRAFGDHAFKYPKPVIISKPEINIFSLISPQPNILSSISQPTLAVTPAPTMKPQLSLPSLYSTSPETTPSIKPFPASPILPSPASQEPNFLIMATDGLWDYLSSRTAVNLVLEKLEEGNTQQTIADDLVKKAKELGSTDDITVLLVFFTNRAPSPGRESSPAETDEEPWLK